MRLSAEDVVLVKFADKYFPAGLKARGTPVGDSALMLVPSLDRNTKDTEVSNIDQLRFTFHPARRMVLYRGEQVDSSQKKKDAESSGVLRGLCVFLKQQLQRELQLARVAGGRDLAEERTGGSW